MVIRKWHSSCLCPLHSDSELFSGVCCPSVPAPAAPPSPALLLCLSPPQATVFVAGGAEGWASPGSSLPPLNQRKTSRWNNSRRVCDGPAEDSETKFWRSHGRLCLSPLSSRGCPAGGDLVGRVEISVLLPGGGRGQDGHGSDSTLASDCADGRRIHLGERRQRQNDFDFLVNNNNKIFSNSTW